MSAGVPNQCTVGREVSLKGAGLHTGRPARLTLKPAEAGAGVVFVRRDLEGDPEIRVSPDAVDIDALARRTELKNLDGIGVATTEHLLAACLGMGLDNVRAELDGPELPILDGSAKPYAKLIEKGGLRELDEPRYPWKLRRPVTLVLENAEICALPAENMELAFFAALKHAGMENQAASMRLGTKDFRKEIAPARTFVFYEEIAPLFSKGLIRGGAIDCSIVIRDGRPMTLKELKKAAKELGGEAAGHFEIPDSVKIDEDWRVHHELAAHKLLDLLGDLAVLGRPISALITARGAGHAINHQFVQMLRKELAP